MKNNTSSGWHLIVDALVRDPGPISDIESLRLFLVDLTRILKTKVLDGPRLFEVPLDAAKLECDSDEGGITGVCVITTSHISLHTWPLRQRFTLDIFSCQRFARDRALALIRERLDVLHDNVTWLERTWPTAATPAASRVSATPGSS